jgi:hypothetical protein
MFQGKHITLQHLGRNRYKLTSAYTLAEKTAAEIDTMLEELMNQARRSALELAVCRQRLREAAAAESVALPQPAPKPVEPAPPGPSEPPPPPPAAIAKSKTRRTRVPAPTPVRKRGRGGMRYVAMLMDQARAQKAS